MALSTPPSTDRRSSTEVPGITARLLPPERWEELRDREPFNVAGLPVDAEHWLIPVVEIDGRIVASCALFDTVHWDAFHVDEAWQKHPAVFGKLLEFSVQTLRERGVQGVHITVPDNRPDLQAMVERFGFVPAPGKLYLYQVPPS